jgi:hypothetical protein
VLVSWLADVKLSDFGIAKLRTATAATGSRLIKGKPGYMSPEQVTGQDKLDGRSDLWAIGVMLWELLTGQQLFKFSGDNFVGIAFAICSDEICRPSVVRTGVPPELEAITMRLMERDLTKRFQSAREVITALRASRYASRDGRAELARYLAERFPERARPVPATSSSSPGPQSTTAPEESSSPGRRAFAVSRPDSPAPPWPSTSDHAQGQAITRATWRAPRRLWLPALGVSLVAFGSIATVRLWPRQSDTAAHPEKSERAELARPPAAAAATSPSAPAAISPAPAPSLLTAIVTTTPLGARVRIEAANLPARVDRSPITIHVAAGLPLHIRAELEGFTTVMQDATIEHEGQAVTLTLSPLNTVAPEAKTVRRMLPPVVAPTKPNTPQRKPAPTDDPGIIE